ncbi:MAG: trypsin-like peptidase domain-containing protein [Cyclobacteriaceae bacterium]|nr:trypsin-like peptidase domain-containing protein [Cyclobacteriaceae bacterium]UYN86036.1 MAG: trypsin-like peptidase domain-containing protein [Cyclobacteriaceae bacterium]
MKRVIIFTLVIVMVAITGGIVGSLYTVRYLDSHVVPYASIDDRQQVILAHHDRDSVYRIPIGADFLTASKKAVSGVVHIRTAYGSGRFSLNPLELYYKAPARPSGSGVIISDDGYIVTNNHVIEDATNIEVVMDNNQRYYAKIIGTDPSTDLALLKIKARNLPFIKYGNSDAVQPGEWVLAIGNPFDLNSTVTAGIISAKARNIGILRDRNNLQVEAFIQTDAAVNPGNSGGALVNLRGELVGINTAIATATGSYSGYSFAIPVSLVKKVMDDLLEFGQVQRGLLGIQISDVDANVADRLSLALNRGVLVNRVNRGSAAEESGLLQGDVITAIDAREVNSVSELQEWVARNRPGKEISVTFVRGGEKREVKTRLKNNEGKEDLSEPEIKTEWNGARFEEVGYTELMRLKLDGGVLVKSIKEGKWKDAGIKEGFVIAYIDKVPVDNLQDLNRMLNYKRGGVLVEGFYPSGEKGTYGLEW